MPFVLVATSPAGETSRRRSRSPTWRSRRSRCPKSLRESVTVVSGVAPSLDLLPGSVATVLTREELEQRAPQRLYQALESIAGASKLGDGADAVPVLRNLGRGRTLILIDGARVTAERRAGPSATFVDPASLASVEILRGPGSVVYGSDAFGGVLNAVTRDPELDRRHLSYGVEGSFDAADEHSGFVGGSTPIGAGALLVEGHFRDAGNFGDGRRRRDLQLGLQLVRRGAALRRAGGHGAGCGVGSESRPRRRSRQGGDRLARRSGPTIRTRTRIA